MEIAEGNWPGKGEKVERDRTFARPPFKPQRYPVSRRDFSLPCGTHAGDMVAAIRRVPFVLSVRIFDDYRDGDERRIGVEVVFGAHDRTLSGEELNGLDAEVRRVCERISEHA